MSSRAFLRSARSCTSVALMARMPASSRSAAGIESVLFRCAQQRINLLAMILLVAHELGERRVLGDHARTRGSERLLH